MACLVSVSFSTRLRPPQTLLKKICLQNSAPTRLSFKAAVRTATNLFAPCISRGTFSLSQSSHTHLTASNHFGEIVSSCTCMIITGYWVGPDIDDGWGFVEAFVNQIT